MVRNGGLSAPWIGMPSCPGQQASSRAAAGPRSMRAGSRRCVLMWRSWRDVHSSAQRDDTEHSKGSSAQPCTTPVTLGKKISNEQIDLVLKPIDYNCRRPHRYPDPAHVTIGYNVLIMDERSMDSLRRAQRDSIRVSGRCS